jgi:predicted Zn-dependent protease
MANPNAQLPYHGLNTSLYGSLPVDAIRHLERAIWLKKSGQTSAARTMFVNEVRSHRNVPVVIIAHADLELEAGRWGRAWRILDSALEDLKKDGSGADPDLPEHRLMAMTRAMLGIRHRGYPDTAIRELERSRQWLWNVPVAEYTDVQVRAYSS